MRQDKSLIFQLRREGKSYLDIHKQTGVSRATLATWFKNVEWSKHTTIKNREKNLHDSKDRILRMNMARKRSLDVFYAAVEEEAAIEYRKYRGDPLFWAGLMAYAGEGDKRTKSLVRITNSEFYIHTIFITFMEKYLNVPRNSIKVGLLLYPDHNESLCREMWSNLLGVDRTNFHKTQVLQGKEKVKRLQYGIGMSILSSTALKKKLLVWLSLAQDERFQ